MIASPSAKKRFPIHIVLSQNINGNDKYNDLGKILISIHPNIRCCDFVIATKKLIDKKYKNQHSFSYAVNTNEAQNGLKLFIRPQNDHDITNLQQKWCEIVDFDESISDYLQKEEVIVFVFRLTQNNHNHDIPADTNHNIHPSSLVPAANRIKIVYFDNECSEIKQTFETISETMLNDLFIKTNECAYDIFVTAGFPLPQSNATECVNILKTHKYDTLYVSQRWIQHEDAFILPYKESQSDKSKTHTTDTIYQTIPDTLRLSASWIPYIAQTRKGMSSFLSCLYVITNSIGQNKENVLGKIRYLTQNKFPPFLLSLKILFERRCHQLTKHHKAVISNNFYSLFRNIIPNKICNDNSKVLQYSHIIFSYILGNCSDKMYKRFEKYEMIQLKQALLKEKSNPSLETKLLKKQYPRCDEVYIWDYQKVASDGIEYKDVELEDEEKWIKLANSIGNNAENKMMRIVPTLSIKNLSCSCEALTLDNNGDLCALCGAVKDDKNTRIYYCPLQRALHHHELDELAQSIAGLDLNINSVTGYIDDGDVVDDRQPLEAIMVCLDRSLSMTDSFFGDSMCRLDVVKQYFDAFLNRSKAYDYANHIGLILFGSKIETTCNISPLYETFRDKINEIETEGRTALRDAMKEGWKQLNAWKMHYSNRRNCSLRIIVLTDGIDNRSITKENDLLRILMHSDITADAIMIGKHNKSLHAICCGTGGYVFYPKTFRDGLRIFELETFLSITERGDLEHRKKGARGHGMRYYESTVDLCDENHVPRGKINKHLQDPTVSLKSKVQKIERQRSVRNMYNSQMKTRKIIREMSDIMKDPHPFWRIFVDDKDITFWKLLLSGPPNTPYEGGTFVLFMDLSDDYPEKAPKMRFITPIKHVNVNSYGRICHSIFDRNYNPDVQIRDILNNVYGLLINPDWDDPLDSVLRQEYADNHELFRLSIRDHVQTYAMSKPRQQMIKELSGENAVQAAHSNPNARKRGFFAMMGGSNDSNNANKPKKRRLS